MTSVLRLLYVLAIGAAPVAAQTARPTVRSQADLPQHTYSIGRSASALLTDRAAFDSLATRLRADIEADLREYDIADRKTRRNLFVALEQLAFLRGDWDATFAFADSVSAQETEPAARVISGFTFREVVEADRYGGDLQATIWAWSSTTPTAHSFPG